MRSSRLFLMFIGLSLSILVSAQKDSLVLINGDIIVGDLKQMKLGIVTIKTDYSEEDFQIKWPKVKSIRTTDYMRIFNDDGALLIGKLSTDTLSKHLIIKAFAGTYERPLLSIVELSEVKETFIDKLSLGLDVGYNFTKASNTGQTSIRGNIGFQERKWELASTFNLYSTRIDTSVVSRGDANLTINIFLSHNWYALASIGFSSSDEQMLKLRTIASAGMGNYLVQNYKMLWSVEAGVSFNNEVFTDEEDDVNRSGELYFGTNYNYYGGKKLDFLSNVKVFPSVTDEDRVRVSCNVDLKYDITDDFNIKLGYTLNYDSRPPNDAEKSDYVFSLTFGWEL